MQLESIFVKYFFFPFILISIISILLVSMSLNHFIRYHRDIITSNDMLEIEEKYATTILNNVNLIVTDSFVKLIYNFHQIINTYQTIANKINENQTLDYTILKYLISFNKSQNFNELTEEESYLYLSWFVDQYTTEKNLTSDNKTNLFNQLSIISHIIKSLYIFKKSFNNIIKTLYFLFEDTNLYVYYPYANLKKSGIIDEVFNFTTNPSWCTDENGEIYKTFRITCRSFYFNMKRATEVLYDNNAVDQQHRTIFISDVFTPSDKNSESNIYNNKDLFLTTCVKFNDNISNKTAYLCADMYDEKLFDSLDNLNFKLRGNFIITSIGYQKMFYYPKSNFEEELNTISEYIFKWESNYYLEEKINFSEYYESYFMSNYLKLVNKNRLENDPTYLFNPITINNEQFFYVNNEKNYYLLFPIIMKNLNNEYEHVLSIVYFYKINDYIKNMLNYNLYDSNEFILQIILYIFFGYTTVYLVLLGIKLLAKYIVIPIRNVLYMIKGINIGGSNRLQYLENLLKKEEEIQNKLKHLNTPNNINNYNTYYDENDDTKIAETEGNTNTVIQNNENNEMSTYLKQKSITGKTPENEKSNNILSDVIKSEMNKNKSDNMEIIKKEYYDQCQNYENEINYYDFNEEFLQYRPAEVNELVNLLLNLKEAYSIATKKSNNLQNIISYSKAKDVFEDFKKIPEKSVCDSNMGNLLSQLYKYDKAIYHLVSSLQQVKLRKYLSKVIKDDFDESDALFNLIDLKFNTKIKIKSNTNQLVIKQQNNSYDTFQKSALEKLINERYNKLIYVYYKFFSLMRKANNKNINVEDIYSHKIYHTINNYHKIVIQYIYLCYVSNDLIKIGESILDYIEFLIKFKLKSNFDTMYVMRVFNFKEREKQNIKKSYFDKILRWFNLFDNYIDHVYSKTNLMNEKSIFDEYKKSTNVNKDISDYINDSVKFFKINEQRGDFLKAKFSYVCQSYGDSLFYFIRAAKKRSIICDGLIKKRALKSILKISKILQSEINKLPLKYKIIPLEEILPDAKEYNRIVNIISHDSNTSINDNETYSINEPIKESTDLTFGNGVKSLMKEITKDISDCEIQQFKDIIIIIDNNCSDSNIILKFIDGVKDLLKPDKNNLNDDSDRLSIFFIDDKYHIICPLIPRNQIDYYSIIKNLEICCLNKNFEEETFQDFEQTPIKDEFNINKTNTKVTENSIDSNKSNSENLENSELEEEEEEGEEISDENNDSQFKDYAIMLKNIISSINFCIKYLKMKDIGNKDKYIIYFTNFFNNIDRVNNIIKNELVNLKKKNNINFIIVGKLFEGVEDKLEKQYIKNIISGRRNIINSVLQKFGKKSQIIESGNIKKIKTILSTNNVINDNIIFCNEYYSQT